MPILLWLIVVVLLVRVFWPEGRWSVIRQQESSLALLQEEIENLRIHNNQLTEQLMAASHDMAATEESARWNLGLVKDHETYFQVTDSEE